MAQKDSGYNPHSGHRSRVKKRFQNEGLQAFEDHNVLELLLFYSVPQMDTNNLAHALIDEFGSLSGVFDAPLESLVNVNGIGENSAVLIKLLPELFARYEQDKLKNETVVLNSSSAAGDFFVSKFIGEAVEKLYAVCLDNKCKILKFLTVSEGDINFTDMNIRKIAGAAINSNSTSIIIAHNHPSGVAAPSAADIDATRNLILTLKKLDIKVNDHIIVSGKEYFSFALSSKFKFLF